MLKNRLTCIIHSCDAYSDLWEHNYFFLEKNWKDRGIETYLLTDKETDRSFENMKIVSAGEGTEMPQRTKYLLPFIETEYVLITLDDYFPIYPINNERIERLLDIMDKENLDYIRLFSDPNSHRRWKKYDKLYHIPLDKDYDVNLYQGIWRKSFLERTVKQPLNAWQYEVTLTRIAKEIDAKCVLSKGGEYRILDVIRKGMLLHKADRYLKKCDISIPTRSLISYREELRLYIFSMGSKILPKPAAKLVKKILTKKGFKFYSDSI